MLDCLQHGIGVREGGFIRCPRCGAALCCGIRCKDTPPRGCLLRSARGAQARTGRIAGGAPWPSSSCGSRGTRPQAGPSTPFPPRGAPIAAARRALTLAGRPPMISAPRNPARAAPARERGPPAGPDAAQLRARHGGSGAGRGIKGSDPKQGGGSRACTQPMQRRPRRKDQAAPCLVIARRRPAAGRPAAPRSIRARGGVSKKHGMAAWTGEAGAPPGAARGGCGRGEMGKRGRQGALRRGGTRIVEPAAPPAGQVPAPTRRPRGCGGGMTGISPAARCATCGGGLAQPRPAALPAGASWRRLVCFVS